jgi:queuine tRNA-ribosyltransferase
LFLAGEILVLRLITAHNLHLYGQLVREARAAIVAGQWPAFADAWSRAGTGDPD